MTSGWERVHGNEGNETARLEVPGGWIYRTIVFGEATPTVAMVFVPRCDAAKELRAQ